MATRPAGTKPLGAPTGGGSVSDLLRFSTGLRNHLLDEIEVYVGTAPLLRIYSGQQPDTLTESPTGTLLAEITLPSDWMSAASGAVKGLLGSWSVAAVGTGIANPGYWRLRNSGDTETIMQSSVSGTNGSGKVRLDDPDITSGQTVTINVFNLTGGNA